MSRYIPKPDANPLVLNGYICNDEKVKELSSHNLFIAEVISALQRRNAIKWSPITHLEAQLLCEAFTKTGWVDKIHSFADFADDVNIFWDLVKYGQERGLKGTEKHNHAIHAVCQLYSKLMHTQVFSDNFKKDPKSPYYFMNKQAFVKFISDPKITRKNFYAVWYQDWLNPRIFHYDYKSQYLFDRIYITLTRHKIHKNSAKISRDISLTLENYIISSEAIKGYKDFTANRFTMAIKLIKEDNNLTQGIQQSYLKLLFNLWHDLITDYPKYDFFMNSPLYNTDVILDGYTHAFLGKDYIPVKCNQMKEMPAYEKALFIINNSDLRTSIGKGHEQIAFDCSDIKDAQVRKILMNYANYCLANGHKSYGNIKKILLDFIIPEKKKQRNNNLFYLSTKELINLRNQIHFSDLKPKSKSTLFQKLKTFLKWAQKNHYITVEERALEQVRSLPCANEYAPRSLTQDEIKKINKSLQELGKRDERFLAVKSIFNIQLNSEARIGEITSIKVSNIKFDNEGKTCKILTRIKNNGKDRMERLYSDKATQFIKRAIIHSRTARHNCPPGEYKDCLFLYKVTCPHARSYNIININRYDKDLQEACRLAGIEKIKSGNVRDTYMTASDKFGKKYGLTIQEKEALRGHRCRMTANSYIDNDFRDLLDECKNVTIGNL